MSEEFSEGIILEDENTKYYMSKADMETLEDMFKETGEENKKLKEQNEVLQNTIDDLQSQLNEFKPATAIETMLLSIKDSTGVKNNIPMGSEYN